MVLSLRPRLSQGMHLLGTNKIIKYCSSFWASEEGLALRLTPGIISINRSQKKSL